MSQSDFPPPSPAATSALAVNALVFGILGIVTCFPLFAIPAVVCGIVGLNNISASAGRLGGRRMAIAGVVLGGIGIALMLLVIMGTLLPALSEARRNAMRQENNTRLRAIHQAMVVFSADNADRLPGMDVDGNVTAASASHRYDILLDAKLLSPDSLISPLDRQRKAWAGGTVVPENFSYAMLEIATPGARQAEWACESPSLFRAVMVGDRNAGTDAGPNVRSIHTKSRGSWEGSIVFNDNHVTYESSHIIGPTQYGSATPTEADNLFLDERSGDDAYMVAD